jgi:ribosomal protein L44E
LFFLSRCKMIKRLALKFHFQGCGDNTCHYFRVIITMKRWRRREVSYPFLSFVVRCGTAHVFSQRHSRVNRLMIHYTCDRCKKTINQSLEVRYQVKIDVQSIGEPDKGAPCEDVDSLSELHQLLDGLHDDEEQSMPEHALSFSTQYDLCPRCYRLFSSNPLGRELAIAIGFSNN